MAPPFFTSALDGGEWSTSRLDRYTPGETDTGTHLIGVWVDPRAGLNAMNYKKSLALQAIEPRLLGPPVRSVVAIPTEVFNSRKNRNNSFRIHIYTYNLRGHAVA
jgi:hypothetical protein